MTNKKVERLTRKDKQGRTSKEGRTRNDEQGGTNKEGRTRKDEQKADDKLGDRRDAAASGQSLVCGRGGCGGCDVSVGWDGFAAAIDEDLLLALVIEVYVEDGGAAAVPNVFGDGEVEEDHALGGLAWADHGIAQERFGGQGLEGGEGGVDVLEVEFFDCAGGDLFAFCGGEGGGEVLEEEREVEAVIDAQGGEDVEGVFGVLIGDDDGVGFEDSVGGVDGGADDGEVSGSAGGEAEKESENDS
jgi:hypothetical protein